MRVLAYLLVALALPALAVTSTPSLPQTPKNNIVQFLQGTDAAGTYKTLVTAGSNGTKCVALYATNSGASTGHLVTIQLKRSGVSYGGTAVTVPLSAGFATGVAGINMMSTTNWVGLPFDSDGNPFFFLESGDTLVATFATALDTGTVVNLVAVCADF